MKGNEMSGHVACVGEREIHTKLEGKKKYKGTKKVAGRENKKCFEGCTVHTIFLQNLSCIYVKMRLLREFCEDLSTTQ
jgi:hypothetical protein